MSWLQRVSQKVVRRFLDASQSSPDAEGPPMLIENPTEEILDAIARNRDLKIYGAAGGAGVIARDALKSMARKSGDIRYEENFFFSTRRYPKAATNALPLPSHIPAGSYLFFATPVGVSGETQGFPTGFEMTTNETNSDTANSTPQGKGYKIWQEGVAFNMEALSEDIEQILDSGALAYQVQGAQFTLRKGPLRGWPGGEGVSGFTSTQGQESAHNGIADPRAMRTLKFARVIKPLQNFNYVHEVGRGIRASDGSDWELSAFTLCSVMLWGHQLDAVPG